VGHHEQCHDDACSIIRTFPLAHPSAPKITGKGQTSVTLGSTSDDRRTEPQSRRRGFADHRSTSTIGRSRWCGSPACNIYIFVIKSSLSPISPCSESEGGWGRIYLPEMQRLALKQPSNHKPPSITHPIPILLPKQAALLTQSDPYASLTHIPKNLMKPSLLLHKPRARSAYHAALLLHVY
jgi:hypothetical protein